MPKAQALTELSAAILKLHKALLDYQKQKVEESSGKKMSPYEVLGAVLNHEDFSWLKPLSQMVVKIDLAAESEKDSQAHALESANSPSFNTREIKEFWANPPSVFQDQLILAIQENPDVSFLFSEVRVKASVI